MAEIQEKVTLLERSNEYLTAENLELKDVVFDRGLHILDLQQQLNYYRKQEKKNKIKTALMVGGISIGLGAMVGFIAASRSQ